MSMEQAGAPPLLAAVAAHEEHCIDSFCCATCKCSDERQQLYRQYAMAEEDGSSSLALQTHDGGVLHRRCCHQVQCASNWWAPMDVVHVHKNKKVVNDPKTKEKYSYTPHHRDFVVNEIGKAENNVKRLWSDDNGLHPGTLQWHQPDFHSKVFTPFRHAKSSRDRKEGGIVVLELFAGTGAGMVALKLLGINVDKVISVDTDLVANHVNRYNHDKSYNEKLKDDGIEHVFLKFPSFESIYNNLDSFMEKYGPIDLIPGGPPCIDYTKLNARAEGANGESGQLLLQTADLIQRIQKHPLQQGRHAFYLIENVVLSGDDLQKAKQAFGNDIEPWPIDSACFSPCKRKRMYFSNIPLFAKFDKEETTLMTPSTCLEDDCISTGNLDDAYARAKTNTFMASKGRINHNRMLVFRRTAYHTRMDARVVNATERARMMGFPEGYFGPALEELYSSLAQAFTYNNEVMDHYVGRVPEKYYCFQGEDIKVHRMGEEFGIAVKINPPSLPPYGVNRSRVHYSQEEYAMRLIGNGWNIPTIVELLRPLRDVFNVRVVPYPGYDYLFAWDKEIENTNDGVPEQRENAARGLVHNFQRGGEAGGTSHGLKTNAQAQASTADECIVIMDDSDEDDDDEEESSGDDDNGITQAQVGNVNEGVSEHRENATRARAKRQRADESSSVGITRIDYV